MKAIHPLVFSVRLVVPVALALLLGACQRTVFQNPPAAAEACDPALAGRWLSQGDTPKSHGELEVLVGADCSLRAVEHKPTGARRSEPTTLRNARVGGVRYLWLDAGWTHRSFEIDPNLLDREGDVYLFAYSISRDHLRLANAPHRALAHRVLDKDIAGEVLMQENDLMVRVSGDVDAVRKVLGKHRLFRFDEALHFRRARGDSAP